ncbi:MAG: Uma2 family endonuclease [Thermoguttaceae bacterium]
MSLTTHVTTAETLLAARDLDRCELLRGELVMMSPAGSEHGFIVANITAPLATFVKQNGLGAVFGAETGFQIGHNPDTVRAPDVAFVSAERIGGRPGKGFFQGAPDLAVEVVSPRDRAGEVLAKVGDWLDAGCRAVWVVDPESRTVLRYRGRSDVCSLGSDATLDAGNVVPGFQMRVAEVFGDS